MSEWLEKMRSIGAVRRGRHVREGRDSSGARFKAVTDEAGNTVTERGDRQDVTINAPRIVAQSAVREERN